MDIICTHEKGTRMGHDEPCLICENHRLRAELEQLNGFHLLMDRLCKDAPILPCSEYSQDVAMVAYSIDSWRKVAIKRERESAMLREELEKAQTKITGVLLAMRRDAHKWNTQLQRLLAVDLDALETRLASRLLKLGVEIERVQDTFNFKIPKSLTKEELSEVYMIIEKEMMTMF